MKEKRILPFCMLGFCANLLLFITKLYIGLASNSISIYSDGINNLFDSISGILSFLCLTVLMQSADVWGRGILKKSEGLLSLIMSAILGGAGFYFAYSSLERLMYPTPVSFTVRYLVIVSATALIKLMLFIVFRAGEKKTGSPIIKVMAFDSLLDFFITCVTVLTLLMSAYGRFSLDAVCGLVISAVIIVSAVKMILSHIKKLIGYMPVDLRQELEESILSTGAVSSIETADISFEEDRPVAYIKLKFNPEADAEEEKIRIHTLFEEKQIEVNIL